jgi:hypothetical protein
LADWAIVGGATVFAVWVVFLGGAERIEGTIKSAFLIHSWAPYWHAAGIKAYIAISWVGLVIWVLIR